MCRNNEVGIRTDQRSALAPTEGVRVAAVFWDTNSWSHYRYTIGLSNYIDHFAMRTLAYSFFKGYEREKCSSYVSRSVGRDVEARKIADTEVTRSSLVQLSPSIAMSSEMLCVHSSCLVVPSMGRCRLWHFSEVCHSICQSLSSRL